MEEALVKRVLPHSVEAEQSVIGAMLMDRDAIIAASETVVADEFYQRQYGVMFETMVGAVQRRPAGGSGDPPEPAEGKRTCRRRYAAWTPSGTSWLRCPRRPMCGPMPPLSTRRRSFAA